MVVLILAERMEALRSAVERLSRRAVRLGLGEVFVSVLARRSVWTRGDCVSCHARQRRHHEAAWEDGDAWRCDRCGGAVQVSTAVEVVEVQAGGVEVVRVDGWRVLASLDLVEGSYVARPWPGVEESEGLVASGDPARCDHCKLERQRATTYALEHVDGRRCVVGSTCLADFLGRSAAALVAGFEIAEELALAVDGAAGDGWEVDGCGRSALYRMESILGHAVAAVNLWGYRRADEDGSTAEAVREALHKERAVPVEARARAAEVLAWCVALPDDGDGSEYLRSLATLARAGVARWAHIGIAASAVVAYARARQRELERDAAIAAGYVGTVKKREVFDVQVTGRFSFETQFGITSVYRMRHIPSGAVLVWKTSTGSGDLEQGATVRIKATVKEHSIYREAPQTVVTRVQVVP